MLGKEYIESILPHRDPFLLIDQVIEVVPGQSAQAQKQVSAQDPWFAGHFPTYPVMPGVLIVEALAQTGALALLSLPENQGKLAFFAGIDKARFRLQVRPGDLLELQVRIERIRHGVGFGHGQALLEGKVAAQGDLMFALQEKN